MAPHFKFGKKHKVKKEGTLSASPVSNSTPSSSNTSQSEAWHPGQSITPTKGKQNYPRPNGERIMVDPVQKRSVSTQSTLQQHVYTPWNRVRLEKSPFPRYRHVASSYATDQGELFVIGGLHDQSVYGDTWIIKSIDNGTRFRSVAIPISDSTPPPRVGHASTLCGNAFVIFGGDTHKVNEAGLMDDDVYLFNINSHKWTIPKPQGPRPLGRYGHKISIIAANPMKTKLYVFGGQFDDTYFNDLAVYDLSSFRRPDSHWEFIKPDTFMPPPLTNHTMVSYDNKLWVFGGDTPQGLTNELFMFDPSVNDWTVVKTTGAQPPPVQEHAAVIYRDLMCVFGGKDAQDNYSQSTYFLNLKSLKWFKFPAFNNMIPRARSGHSLTLLGNNKLLIMGGDKFDYAFASQTDLRTSDVDMGAGTIVYTLDLTKLHELCPGIFHVEGLASQDNFTTPVLKSNSRFDDIKNKEVSILSPDVSSSINSSNLITTPSTRKASESVPTSVSTNKPKSPVPARDINAEPPRVLSLQSHRSSDTQSDTDPDVGSVEVVQYGTSPERGDVKRYAVTDNKAVPEIPTTPNTPVTPGLQTAAAIAAVVAGETKPKPTADSIGEPLVSEFPHSQQRENKPAVHDQRDILAPAGANNNMDSTPTITLSEPARVVSEKSDPINNSNNSNNSNNNINNNNNNNNLLKELLSELKQLKEDTVVSANRANQRITELELENAELKQFNQLSHLNDMIKYQAEVIAELQSDSNYKEKYMELQSKYRLLDDKYQLASKELKSKETFINENIKKYSESIDSTIAQVKQRQAMKSPSSPLNRRRDSLNELTSKLNQMMIENKELTTSKDQLFKEYSKLKNEHSQVSLDLSATNESLLDIENNYKSVIDSLRTSGNAIEKLQNEVLKLKKENARLESELEQRGSNSSGSSNDTHYQLKIKDLRAEIFIIKEERDSLKEDIMTLKKKLLDVAPSPSL